jgi:hypothetical protein
MEGFLEALCPTQISLEFKALYLMIVI